MDHRFLQQTEFLLEVDKLKNVIRQNYLADGSRRENDTEHSWHIAIMVALMEEYFLGIDILKTLKMVLLHDLVEIDAGDTFAYDIQGYTTKEARETEAAHRIFGLLPTSQKEEYLSLWQEFESMKTPESICGAIMDRIQPLMLNYHSQGKMWKLKNITSEQIRERNSIVFEKGPLVFQEYVESIIQDALEKGYLNS
jgi:putative hydrolase of HD superfamily